MRTITSFNPTLVRLKPGSLSHFRFYRLPFQSHFGSIKTGDSLEEKSMPALFQSHFGSIKTVPRAKYVWTREKGFNPTLVRLKPVVLAAIERYGDVSIPLWFD